VGLPPDALQQQQNEKKNAREEPEPRGSPSPLRKKQKSDSPRHDNDDDEEEEEKPPASPTLPPHTLERIGALKKKGLLEELKQLGEKGYNINMRKDDLVAALVDRLFAGPAAPTQVIHKKPPPAASSQQQHAALSQRAHRSHHNSSNLQSPAKISNDDDVPQQKYAAVPKDMPPPTWSVKRAVAEREALSKAAPAAAAFAGDKTTKQPLKQKAKPAAVVKKEADEEKEPAATPEHKLPRAKKQPDTTPFKECPKEPAAAAPSSASARKVIALDESPEDNDDAMDDETESAIQVVVHQAKAMKVVALDDESPEEDVADGAAAAKKVDSGATAQEDESQPFSSAQEDLTESQEESQRKLKVKQAEKYQPKLAPVPGSTQKSAASPAFPSFKLGKSPGLAQSVQKYLESARKDASRPRPQQPGPAARTLDFALDEAAPPVEEAKAEEPSLTAAELSKKKEQTTLAKIQAESKQNFSTHKKKTHHQLASTQRSLALSGTKDDHKKRRLAEMREKHRKEKAAAAALAKSTKHVTTNSPSKLPPPPAKKPSPSSEAKKRAAYPSSPSPGLLAAVKKGSNAFSPLPSFVKKPSSKKDLFSSSKKRAAPPPSPYSDKKPSAKKKSPMVEDEEDSDEEELVAVYDPNDNYLMTDTEASDYESDEDAEFERRTNKAIPDWARSQALKDALEIQYGLDYPHDPDELFGEVSTCDLVQVFNITDQQKILKLRRRRSSGNWTRDRLTSAEKLKYKRDLKALRLKAAALKKKKEAAARAR